MSILPPKSSDDLFLVIDSILSVFCLSPLSEIMIYNIYNTFLSQNLDLTTKNSSLTPIFSQLVVSLTSNNSTSQNIGGRMHGPSLDLKFWGDSPPSPPKSPSMGEEAAIHASRSFVTDMIDDEIFAMLDFATAFIFIPCGQ